MLGRVSSGVCKPGLHWEDNKMQVVHLGNLNSWHLSDSSVLFCINSREKYTSLQLVLQTQVLLDSQQST